MTKVPARHRHLLKGDYLISLFISKESGSTCYGESFYFHSLQEAMVYISPRQGVLSDNLNASVTEISDNE